MFKDKRKRWRPKDLVKLTGIPKTTLLRMEKNKEIPAATRDGKMKSRYWTTKQVIQILEKLPVEKKNAAIMELKRMLKRHKTDALILEMMLGFLED